VSTNQTEDRQESTVHSKVELQRSSNSLAEALKQLNLFAELITSKCCSSPVNCYGNRRLCIIHKTCGDEGIEVTQHLRDLFAANLAQINERHSTSWTSIHVDNVWSQKVNTSFNYVAHLTGSDGSKGTISLIVPSAESGKPPRVGAGAPGLVPEGAFMLMDWY